MRKKLKRIVGLAAAFALVIAAIPAQTAKAASGTVYTCSVTPSYSNPVTGEIEDSGGEAGYATGQGMVQSVVYSSGILEVTDSGEYYLTVRLGMMDYASGHSFWVQNVGDSGWSTPAVGQTGSGSDGNGATADICIQVPSENCVVRASMYVEPMGRDVIFFFYPSGYSEGNNTDMTATMVTATSGSAGSSDQTSAGNESGGNESAGSATSSASTAGGNASLKSSSQGTTTKEQSTGESGKSSELKSSITEAETPSTSDTAVNDATGLSLSTETETEDTDSQKGSLSTAGTIFGTAAAVTISGLILMGAAAGILYLFRKNWYRWGGGEDDDA